MKVFKGSVPGQGYPVDQKLEETMKIDETACDRSITHCMQLATSEARPDDGICRDERARISNTGPAETPWNCKLPPSPLQPKIDDIIANINREKRSSYLMGLLEGLHACKSLVHTRAGERFVTSFDETAHELRSVGQTIQGMIEAALVEMKAYRSRAEGRTEAPEGILACAKQQAGVDGAYSEGNLNSFLG